MLCSLAFHQKLSILPFSRSLNFPFVCDWVYQAHVLRITVSCVSARSKTCIYFYLLLHFFLASLLANSLNYMHFCFLKTLSQTPVLLFSAALSRAVDEYCHLYLLKDNNVHRLESSCPSHSA